MTIRHNDGCAINVAVSSLRGAIAECRAHGDTAISATVYSVRGTGIATYRRDTGGNGRRWFKAVS